MRRSLLLPGLLFFTFGSLLAGDDLSIHIAYPAWRPAVDKSPLRSYVNWRMWDENFAVVIRNESKRNIRIFSPNNMWGCNDVYFIASLKDGRQVSIVLRPRPWTSNYVSYYILKAGEDIVFTEDISNLRRWDWELIHNGKMEPYINPKRLKRSPVPKFIFGADMDAIISIKPVFSIPKTREAAESGIWTGAVTGKPVQLKINIGEFINTEPQMIEPGAVLQR